MLNDPLITWNLIVCIICFPALGFFLKREFTNISTEIASLKKCMVDVKVDMENKVDREDCEGKSDEKWERIYHHRHADDGAVIVTH